LSDTVLGYEASSRHVLILDPVGIDGSLLISAASRLGFTAHLALLKPVPIGSEHRADPAVIVDFADEEQALFELTAYGIQAGIAGVVTMSEFLTPLCARVASALGLPGNDATFCVSARNKREMSRRFDAADVRAPVTFGLHSEEDLDALVSLEKLRFPMVLKPVESAGSAGVTVVGTQAELREAFERARAACVSPYGTPLDDTVLAQSYAPGPEYSVESASVAGSSHPLCITQKMTSADAYRVEVGHCVPAMLTEDERHEILAQTATAIAAVGITNSLSHTELKRNSSGRYEVIEIAARLGAGRIGTLIGLAFGIDVYEALLLVSVGLAPDLSATRARSAASRFIKAPRSGVLGEVAGLPPLGEDVHVVSMRAISGSRVADGSSSKGRIGHFVVVGDDAPSVNLRADHLLAQVSVSMLD
jgi:biotin carboxylase